MGVVCPVLFIELWGEPKRTMHRKSTGSFRQPDLPEPPSLLPGLCTCPCGRKGLLNRADVAKWLPGAQLCLSRLPRPTAAGRKASCGYGHISSSRPCLQWSHLTCEGTFSHLPQPLPSEFHLAKSSNMFQCLPSIPKSSWLLPDNRVCMLIIYQTLHTDVISKLHWCSQISRLWS